MIDMKENYVYFLDNKPYINMTNACTNNCVFCVRNQKIDVQGAKLWLEWDDVRSVDVIKQIEDYREKISESDEIVFCGYGEPLTKVYDVLIICKYLRNSFPKLKIRINTNGHANRIHNVNTAILLAPFIDSISVSLNAQNEQVYNAISRPKIKDAYEEVKRFIRACVEEKIDTTASIVTNVPGYPVDAARCEVIAKSLGAKFRARDFIMNGY